ncbi:MAG: hypothetical protein QOD42_1094 [Sphingomonadales bacterium]|nr:hypothetical protein [Sphingomonadales bacterium]
MKGAFAEMPPARPHPANLAGLGATGAVRGAVAPLFTPFTCGTLRLPNRIAMAPMTRWHSPGGVPGPDVADYYARRARGGAGLILTEGVNIDHPGASGYDDVPALFGAEAGRGWRAVVGAVHAAGAAIIPQLWHVGAFRRAGVGRDPAAPGFGPARIVEHGKTVVRRLDRLGIEAITASYARAARVAVEVGFDGIEIHGAHGYLLDQFFWSQTNRRRDEHGGAIEHRARFAAAVVAAVRKQMPRGMPLIFRFSQWKMNDYQARIAETPAELARLLTPLCEAGVDIFHASTRRFWEPAFAGSPRSLARWTRDLTGRPVIAVGSVGLDKPHQSRAQGGHDAAIAEVAGVEPVLEGLAVGDFDLVAVGRAMLADAQWASKVRRGRLAEIEPLRPHHLKELT